MFLSKAKIQITVSELSLYFSCARKLYYSCRGYKPVFSSSPYYIEHLILKEMAMSYPSLLKASSSKDDASPKELEALLSQVLGDISMIYPVEMEDVATEVLEEVSGNIMGYLPGIQQSLSAQAEDRELLLLGECLSLLDDEPFLSSEKLNMTGIPYRLVEDKGSFEPVIIKTGKAPENGVWMNDRLHLAAFAMLAEEMHGTPVKTGHVMYARSGLFRKVNIRSTDRRQVLQGIGRVRKIKDGHMPDKKEGPLCSTCDHSEMCNVKPSLASKFF
ncbi:Dna2/Cas4 domain-containing protein [Methanolobus sp. WCC4]|uniref:Dna2/Cas4 domain-containing protein n=1 Tax=Methanolobus sp. WCC4 TaxID=3125784 RepID=UPI0030F7D612